MGGTDNDNDGFICDQGEFCGGFPVSNQPLPVTVEAGLDTPGIDFTLEADVEISSVSHRAGRGYRIPKSSVLDRLLETLRGAESEKAKSREQ